jgi:hypothetical protein
MPSIVGKASAENVMCRRRSVRFQEKRLPAYPRASRLTYHRAALCHLIERAFCRNLFTAGQPITVNILGDAVILGGAVSDPDLILEAVAIVESLVPQMQVVSQIKTRKSRVGV